MSATADSPRVPADTFGMCHDNLGSGTGKTPHEPPATLRMQRRGWPAKEVQRLLRLSPRQHVRSLERGIDAEERAVNR